MKRRFWRAVAKFACKRAGLAAVEGLWAGGHPIWTASTPTTTVSGANFTVTWGDK